MADARNPPESLPDIDFATFVLSLGSSALVQLGLISDEQEPGGGAAAREVNLPMAKQTIDILAMLQEKTKGNLDSAEAELLSGLLYDLRVKYVDARKRKSPPPQ
jgi:hypothetical protein